MIVVVADDLSGAAELAGAAFDRGVAAEVQTQWHPSSSARLIAVDTNTRSCPADQAARRVAAVTRAVMRTRPDWVFKKVDSVLRGPVLAELTAMVRAGGWRRVLLAPANPSRGRVIREGLYLVDGTPLAQTDFAADPEHPVNSSSVLELLGECPHVPIRTLRVGEKLPECGIAVAEASDQADMEGWARQIDQGTLAAGAADLFHALLATGQCGRSSTRAVSEHAAGPRNTLFVCGSATAWQAQRVGQCLARGVSIVAMPWPLFGPNAPRVTIGQWASRIASASDTSAAVMMAIGRAESKVDVHPSVLVERMAITVERVLRLRTIDRICIEGGATASALVRRMKWKRMTVCRSYASGVVALAVGGPKPLELVIKPGSYDWPDQMWPKR
jgi:uncharacterized protein YgbK (DUF1537 family)